MLVLLVVGAWVLPCQAQNEDETLQRQIDSLRATLQENMPAVLALKGVRKRLESLRFELQLIQRLGGGANLSGVVKEVISNQGSNLISLEACDNSSEGEGNLRVVLGSSGSDLARKRLPFLRVNSENNQPGQLVLEGLPPLSPILHPWRPGAQVAEPIHATKAQEKEFLEVRLRQLEADMKNLPDTVRQIEEAESKVLLARKAAFGRHQGPRESLQQTEANIKRSLTGLLPRQVQMRGFACSKISTLTLDPANKVVGWPARLVTVVLGGSPKDIAPLLLRLERQGLGRLARIDSISLNPTQTRVAFWAFQREASKP